MGDSAVELVKRAALQAVQARKPLELRFGTVPSAAPLAVRLEGKLTLTADRLLLPKRLSALQPGDQVALLRVQGGGAFYILDQLGGEG